MSKQKMMNCLLEEPYVKNQLRKQILERQARAYTYGAIEYINGQWIFFDDETEEALCLHDLSAEMEILYCGKWERSFELLNDQIRIDYGTILLQNEDLIRIRKKLIYSFDLLLDELDDDAFSQFLITLNSLHFSIYDSIYCYNQLAFLGTKSTKKGVNTIIFDNEDQICTVQHHFSELNTYLQHRFEFTLSTGKRLIVEKLIS